MHTLWFENALLENGWTSHVRLTVDGGIIGAIETAQPCLPTDERHGLVVCGLPNLHSHAFQRAMAGLTESASAVGGDSFWSWRDLMYSLTGRITPDDLEAVASMAFVEMLESGFTHVGEFHYLHHALDGGAYDDPAEMGSRLCSAAAETGIGLTLLPVFYAHAGFGGKKPSDGQRRFVNSLDSFAKILEASRHHVTRLAGGRIGIAPHSLRAVAPHELRALSSQAGGAPIHIHIAEQIKEVEDCLAWSGQRPVDWLLSNIEIGPDWCLVHATHMTDDETAAVARSGAVAGVCPMTEANLGDGIFNGRDYLAAGGRIGIGSDSNVLINAAEEMRWLEYSQRLHRKSRNVLAKPGHSTGSAVFEACLRGGGQALDCPPAIQVGVSADLVTLDPAPAAVGMERETVLDQSIFALSRLPVDTVWRAGEKVVRGGRHLRSESVRAAFRSAMSRLRA